MGRREERQSQVVALNAAAAAPSPAGGGAVFTSGAGVVRRALAAAVLCVLPLAPADEPHAQARRVARADAPAAAEHVVQQTNAFRARHGLPALKVDPQLAAAARAFAEFMAGSDQYGHQADGRQPTERATAHGYEWCMVAENIAFLYSSIGFGTEELATRLLEGWEQSPGHRVNMLRAGMTDIGVGIARSERSQRYYAVQKFGLPKSASARFQVRNDGAAAVRYELDGQEYSLPPRVTRTHQGCFEGALRPLWPDGSSGPAVRVQDGARYVAVREAQGRWQLHGAGRQEAGR